MPTKYGLIFGGALNLREQPSAAANRLALIPNETTLAVVDHNDDWYATTYKLPKPEALVLTYLVISMRPDLTEQQTHNMLLGDPAEASMEAFASVDEQVNADYPSTYIWCGDADKTVKPDSTRRMAAALEKAGVPYQCEIFPGVDHGVGPGTETAAEGWIDHAVAFWKRQQSYLA